MQKSSTFFNQKGATIVEFAIVLSLLLALIFGIVEFGLAIFNRQVITNAAREGARAGIIARVERLSNGEIAKVVVDYAKNHLITFGDVVLTADDVDIDEIDDDLSDGLDTDHRCVVFEYKIEDEEEEDVFHYYRCDLEVTVDYTYEFLFLSNLGIGPINLRATSVMRME
ncbi:MAG: pilus assembly protein [Deltaproteobacteria bacterium]|jgi:hypothetical protein|nr:pilus assembly protein [Deltaproteobacteria bacterium]